MNIFHLDTDIEKAARYHCDKHVVKMPTEYVQLLCTALDAWGYESPMKLTHQNHPCAIWTRQTLGNYQWLWDFTVAVSNEYTRRYGKIHKSHQYLIDGLVPRYIPEQDKGYTEITPLPNCTAYEEFPPDVNNVDLYRIFYLTHKAHILNYKDTEEPWWMGDRFYMQQYNISCGSLPQDPRFKLKGQYEGKALPTKKLTKDGMVKQIGCPSLKALLVKDLEKLMVTSPSATVGAMPSGRLKQPYIDALSPVHKDVNWSKLTVAALKEVIEFYQASK